MSVRPEQTAVLASFAFADGAQLSVRVAAEEGDGTARVALASALTGTIRRAGLAPDERTRPYVDHGRPRFDTGDESPSAFVPGSTAWGLVDVVAPVLHQVLRPGHLVEHLEVAAGHKHPELRTCWGDSGGPGYSVGPTTFPLMRLGPAGTDVDAREHLADLLVDDLVETIFAWGERPRRYTDGGTPAY